MSVSALSGTLALLLSMSQRAEATYSVLATDSKTREVGVAIASCVGDSIDLSTVSLLDEKYGGVVAQSYYFEPGRDELMRLLSGGESPAGALAQVTTESFDSVTSTSGFPFRQYGVVDFSNAAAFTGSDNLPEAGHRTIRLGDVRASLQGNVLTSRAVLESLEKGLRSTDESLVARLILALDEVEKNGGGDSRCAPRPADAFYVRVAGGAGFEAEFISRDVDAVRAWLARLKEAHVSTGGSSPSPPKVPARGGCSLVSSAEGAPTALPLIGLWLIASCVRRKRTQFSTTSDPRLGRAP